MRVIAIEEHFVTLGFVSTLGKATTDRLRMPAHRQYTEESSMSTESGTGPDYNAIMSANALQVFSQRDPEARRRALDQLWVPEGVLYEYDRVVTGLDAISDTVGALLDTLPAGMTFEPVGSALGHHGLGRLRWRAVDGNGQPAGVSGTDVAIFSDGKIAQLYVLLDA